MGKVTRKPEESSTMEPDSFLQKTKQKRSLEPQKKKGGGPKDDTWQGMGLCTSNPNNLLHVPRSDCPVLGDIPPNGFGNVFKLLKDITPSHLYI